MITLIEPERGGESMGALRVELSVPFLPHELLQLRNWFKERGWHVEAEQIDQYFAGEDWHG